MFENSTGECELCITETPIEDAINFAESFGKFCTFIVQTRATRKKVNLELQKLYNAQETLKNGWKENDIVINLENKYEDTDADRQLVVSNGDIGAIITVEDTHFYVKFNHVETPRKYSLNTQEIDLAYGITLHKYQGSEADNVVLILDNFPRFQSKEITYTGITRAKKYIKIFVPQNTWLAATSNEEKSNRTTRLSEYICNKRKLSSTH